LFDHLALFIKKILLKILHDADILICIVPLVVDWISLLIHFDGLTANILDSLLLDTFSKENSELVLILLDPPLHAGVPMILDGVISPTLEKVGDVRPLVSLVPVQQVEDPLLLTGPGGVSLDHWVQVVVPSLPALLSDSPR
jgi:hypothetical protein